MRRNRTRRISIRTGQGNKIKDSDRLPAAAHYISRPAVVCKRHRLSCGHPRKTVRGFSTPPALPCLKSLNTAYRGYYSKNKKCFQLDLNNIWSKISDENRLVGFDMTDTRSML
jgi:hypothetical protein